MEISESEYGDTVCLLAARGMEIYVLEREIKSLKEELYSKNEEIDKLNLHLKLTHEWIETNDRMREAQLRHDLLRSAGL